MQVLFINVVILNDHFYTMFKKLILVMHILFLKRDNKQLACGWIIWMSSLNACHIWPRNVEFNWANGGVNQNGNRTRLSKNSNASTARSGYIIKSAGFFT